MSLTKLFIIIDDGVVINLFTDSIINKKYSLDTLYANYVVNRIKTQESEYKTNERLANLLDYVVADLRTLLGDLPISVFAKDALSAIAIGRIYESVEDLEMHFKMGKGPS